jgi:hypothetical protein
MHMPPPFKTHSTNPLSPRAVPSKRPTHSPSRPLPHANRPTRAADTDGEPLSLAAPPLTRYPHLSHSAASDATHTLTRHTTSALTPCPRRPPHHPLFSVTLPLLFVPQTPDHLPHLPHTTSTIRSPTNPLATSYHPLALPLPLVHRPTRNAPSFQTNTNSQHCFYPAPPHPHPPPLLVHTVESSSIEGRHLHHLKKPHSPLRASCHPVEAIEVVLLSWRGSPAESLADSLPPHKPRSSQALSHSHHLTLAPSRHKAQSLRWRYQFAGRAPCSTRTCLTRLTSAITN